MMAECFSPKDTLLACSGRLSLLILLSLQVKTVPAASLVVQKVWSRMRLEKIRMLKLNMKNKLVAD